MEQIMERIMAIFRADFEKMKDDREGRTTEEKTYREKLMTLFGANKGTREETMAGLEKTEARLQVEEPASEDMTPEVAHEQEVPLEDAVVMPVREPRNRRRDGRNMAAVRRQKKQQKRTQSKDGCRRNLVAARRGTTRCAAVARRKETRQEKSGQKRRCRRSP
jgi:hypothetical protein